MSEIEILGPSVGKYLDREIPAYFVTEKGKRFDFDRIARASKSGVEMSQLADDEALLSPGLIYRPSPERPQQ